MGSEAPEPAVPLLCGAGRDYWVETQDSFTTSRLLLVGLLTLPRPTILLSTLLLGSAAFSGAVMDGLRVVDCVGGAWIPGLDAVFSFVPTDWSLRVAVALVGLVAPQVLVAISALPFVAHHWYLATCVLASSLARVPAEFDHLATWLCTRRATRAEDRAAASRALWATVLWPTMECVGLLCVVLFSPFRFVVDIVFGLLAFARGGKALAVLLDKPLALVSRLCARVRGKPKRG